jgi:manganese transport protein
VQTRKFDRTTEGIKQALKYNFIDLTIALNLFFFVNAVDINWLQPHFIKLECEVAEIQDASFSNHY